MVSGNTMEAINAFRKVLNAEDELGRAKVALEYLEQFVPEIEKNEYKAQIKKMQEAYGKEVD